MKKFIAYSLELRDKKRRWKSFYYFVFSLFLFSLSSQLSTLNCFAEPFYIDHFEKTTNLLGGRTSVYEQPPSRALVTETDRQFYGPAGKSLAIRYDKKAAGGPNDSGGWCGYYSLVKVGQKYFDASPFTKLTFWVKGERDRKSVV